LRRFYGTLLTAIVLICCFTLQAQEAAEGEEQAAAPERRVSREEVEQLREAAANNQTLEEELRSQIVAIYDEALAALTAAAASLDRVEQYNKEREGIAAIAGELEAEMSAPPQALAPDLPEDPSASQLEALLTEERTRLEGARDALRDVEQLVGERNSRRTDLARRLGTVDQQLEVISDQIQSAADTEVHPELGRALRRNLLARREAALAEKEQIRAQLVLFEDRGVLIPWQRDQAQRAMEAATQLVTALEAITTNKQHDEAAQELEDVREQCRLAVERDPELKDIAAETVLFAETLWGEDGIIVKSEQTAQALVQTRKHIADLDRIIELTRRRFEAVGEGGSANQWWPKTSDDMPTLAQIEQEIADREREIPDVQHQLILLEEDRAGMNQLGVEAAEYLSGSPLSGDELAGLTSTVRGVLFIRRQLLDDLIQQYGRYSSQLVELDAVQRNLHSEGKRIVAFLQERLYWSRSVPDPLLPEPADFWEAFLWLKAPKNVTGVVGAATQQAKAQPAVVALWLLVIIALLVLRPWALRRMSIAAERVKNPDQDSVWLTVKAFGYTLMLGWPLPFALHGLGLLILSQATVTYVHSTATAFLYLGMVAGLFEGFRQLLRPDGLGEAHFGWPKAVTRAIHRGLLWPEILLLPLLFVAILFGLSGLSLNSEDALQAYNNSLGRAAFIAAMVILATSMFSILRPRVKVGGRQTEDRMVFNRISVFAFPLIVLTAVVPAFLAIIGYYLSGYLLVYQFLKTYRLAGYLVFIGGIIHRWRIAGNGPNRPTSPEEVLAGQKANQLVRFAMVVVGAIGLFTIWEGALPAAEAMKRVYLLPHFEVVDATSARALSRSSATIAPAVAAQPTAEGGEAAKGPTGSQALPIPATGIMDGPSGDTDPEGGVLTLWNLFQALLAAIITFGLVRDVPGVIYLGLLRRTHLDRGARVAFSTLARYTIMIFGVSATFNLLGLTWDKIQWLAAALTFGLGFGLQEIVANFVSGLILLLERPVRVGDAVTIGNLQGRVTEIQIRATTITLWDRSEMIVPNKEFITSKLVNWTLSDSKRRIDVPIRVAYGSDVKHVKKVLVEVAAKHPNVFDDPSPAALLLEFGDDAMKFELRFFTEFGTGLGTKDQLHVAIFEAFQKEGIEFPIPSLNINMPRRQPRQVPEKSGSMPALPDKI
jgi:potassium-dependent mechanosensitive channel